MNDADINTIREALEDALRTYPNTEDLTLALAALDRFETELERARLISTPGGRSAAASSLELVAPGEQGLSYSWDDRDWQLTVELQQRRADAAEAVATRLREVEREARIVSEIESTGTLPDFQPLADALARAALADVPDKKEAP